MRKANGQINYNGFAMSSIVVICARFDLREQILRWFTLYVSGTFTQQQIQEPSPLTYVPRTVA